MKRIFAPIILLMTSVLTAACSGSGADRSCDPIRPDSLKPGDKVAIVSPSYWMPDTTLQRALNVLRSWGLEPVLGPNVGKMDDGPSPSDSASHYAGTLGERVSDLKWALESDDVKAVICTRGGYGAVHMLGQLPASTFRKNPKWLVGCSDITTFHAASVAAGVQSIHGPMCSAFARGEEPDSSCLVLRDLLMGKPCDYMVEPHPGNVHGSAEGLLVGGNFITFEALFGTEWDFLNAGDDLILFIEEVGETMHAIDRLFNVLVHQKGFSNVRGIVFGDFTECPTDLPYADMEDLLSRYVADLGIPVCFGFQGGHGKVNLPLVEGSRVKLEVGSQGSRIW